MLFRSSIVIVRQNDNNCSMNFSMLLQVLVISCIRVKLMTNICLELRYVALLGSGPWTVVCHCRQHASGYRERGNYGRRAKLRDDLQSVVISRASRAGAFEREEVGTLDALTIGNIQARLRLRLGERIQLSFTAESLTGCGIVFAPPVAHPTRSPDCHCCGRRRRLVQSCYVPFLCVRPLKHTPALPLRSTARCPKESR